MSEYCSSDFVVKTRDEIMEEYPKFYRDLHSKDAGIFYDVYKRIKDKVSHAEHFEKFDTGRMRRVMRMALNLHHGMNNFY